MSHYMNRPETSSQHSWFLRILRSRTSVGSQLVATPRRPIAPRLISPASRAEFSGRTAASQAACHQRCSDVVVSPAGKERVACVNTHARQNGGKNLACCTTRDAGSEVYPWQLGVRVPVTLSKQSNRLQLSRLRLFPRS
jgi:hypothetical protein